MAYSGTVVFTPESSGAHWRWRLAVGVGQPRMHRRKPDLRTETDEDRGGTPSASTRGCITGAAACSRCQVSHPPPADRYAQKSRKKPNSAIGAPIIVRTENFHAASSAPAVRSKLTSKAPRTA